MVIVSPGVYTREIDYSLYAPQLATSVFGIITTASKGPINQLTLVTDVGTLIGTFGYPSANHLGLFAAQQYLNFGRQLWVVRVGTYYVFADDQLVNSDATDPAGVGVALTIGIPEDIGPGSWANYVRVVIATGSQTGTYRLSVQEQDRYGNWQAREVYDRLRVGAAYTANVNYISTRINGVSGYIMVTPDTTYSTLTTGTYTFSGGLDGDPVDDSDVIGVAGSPPVIPSTGLQLFANPETVDVNLLAVPGRRDNTIIQALIALCEARSDCMCLIDAPYGMSVQQIVDWHNGNGGGLLDPTAALNSSYAALYYPWLKVYDSYNDTEVWIPPCGHVAGVMAYTDFVADPWWAPAGLNRGLLRNVLDIEHSATQGERDYMYGSDNCVNPICEYQGQGYSIWGQKTLQKATTALDRINVRRLLLYMRKVVATAVRYLVSEPNDEDTWSWFVNLVEPVCRVIKSQRGLYDFRVICDATTNTPELRDRNEMRGRVLIQPTKTAEMISVDFVLIPTGASFEEYVA